MWKIAFTPREENEKSVEGTAFILTDTYDAVYYEFSPSKKPGSVESMKGRIWNAPIQGFWVPQKLMMEMHVKVVFLVTLADQLIELEEKYSDYRFFDSD